MLKYYNIFQNVSSSSKPFLFNTSMFLILLPCTSGISLLKQNQLLQLFKKVEILHQSTNFDIASSIIVLYRRVRNHFLNKSLKHLPTEDIKPFGQNG